MAPAAALGLAALLSVAGCTTTIPNLTAAPPAVRRGVLPPVIEGGIPNLDEPYPLLPGDRVEIVVRDDESLNIALPIEPDGTIEVWKSDVDGNPRVKIPARGMTVTQLKEEITSVYERTRFKHRPFVLVTLASAVQRVVSIRGAISVPSVELPSTGRLTLYRAIQKAGVMAEDADLSKVTVERRDPATGGKVSLPEYDLEAMLDTANYDRDPPLEPNDIITVPRLGKVTVVGNVNSPGSFLCRRGMRITDLLAQAGWFKPFSKVHKVLVIRDEGLGHESSYNVDVGAILDAQAPYDPLVAPGDRVSVEEDWK